MCKPTEIVEHLDAAGQEMRDCESRCVAREREARIQSFMDRHGLPREYAERAVTWADSNVIARSVYDENKRGYTLD